MRNFHLGLAVAALLLGSTGHVLADEASDRTTAQQIANNLKQSGELSDYRVGVKYENGVAWLSGTVTSLEQKQVAERLARRSAGVEKVISKLEVPGQRRETAPMTRQPVDVSSVQPASAKELQAAMPGRRPGNNMPRPLGPAGPGGVRPAGYGDYAGTMGPGMATGAPQPLTHVPPAVGRTVSYDNPQLPGYAWPSYAANPNYAALTYPKQYSASAWPYIGPFYPYPQVPLGWRKVCLEWDDGWWFLDFNDTGTH